MTSTHHCHLSIIMHPYSFDLSVISPRKLSLTTSHSLHNQNILICLYQSNDLVLLKYSLFVFGPQFDCAFLEDRDFFLLTCMLLFLMLHSQCLSRRDTHNLFFFFTCFFWFVMKCQKSYVIDIQSMRYYGKSFGSCYINAF